MQRQKIRTPRAHISFACPLWVLPWSPMRDEAITYVRNRETQASSPLRSAECGTLVLPTQGAGYHSFTRPLHLKNKRQKTKETCTVRVRAGVRTCMRRYAYLHAQEVSCDGMDQKA